MYGIVTGISEGILYMDVDMDSHSVKSLKGDEEAEKENLSDGLEKLHTDADTERSIEAAVSSGKTVVIPAENVTMGAWSGTGYIVSNPETGAGEYLISGGLKGGAVTGVVDFEILCGLICSAYLEVLMFQSLCMMASGFAMLSPLMMAGMGVLGLITIVNTLMTFALTYEMMIAYTDYMASGDLDSAEQVIEIARNLAIGALISALMIKLMEFQGKGTGGCTRAYKAGYEEHLINGTMGKGQKGVVGGHNFEEFKKALTTAGYDVDDCIVNINKHPTIEGIYEVEYRIPARTYGPNGDLVVIPGQYKTIAYPKEQVVKLLSELKRNLDI